MQNTQKQAYKFAILSVVLWSTVATAFKISLQYLAPIELLFYSSISSLFILLIILIYQKKLDQVYSHIKKNLLMVLILGAINPFAYYFVLFKAYDLLSAQEAQAINYTWALILAYMGVIFLKHKLTKGDILAGFICYFGVFIIATKGDIFAFELSNTLGILLALLSTLLWSLYWIFNAKVKVDAVVGLFSNFLIGVILIGIFISLTTTINIPNIQASFAAIYVGFFEMGITFVFWLQAVKLTSNIAKISNLIFLSPFLSLVFIHFFVGEKILISTIVALSLIVFGLIVQQKVK